jgi:ABC-type phosphate transport system substrate-binding protein
MRALGNEGVAARIKQSLGAITAARFLQVENQLLMLLDLQVEASLPVVK